MCFSYQLFGSFQCVSVCVLLVDYLKLLFVPLYVCLLVDFD